MPLEYRCTALPMAHKTVHDGETRVRRGRRGRGHFPRFTHLNFGVIIVRRRHLLSEDDIIISPECLISSQSGCITHYPGPVGSSRFTHLNYCVIIVRRRHYNFHRMLDIKSKWMHNSLSWSGWLLAGGSGSETKKKFPDPNSQS